MQRKDLATSVAVGILAFILGVAAMIVLRKSQTKTADDSPVTVRGGSLDALAKLWSPGKTCANGNSSFSANVKDSNVAMDGVQQVTNGASSSITATGVNLPWSITLRMRKKVRDGDAPDDRRQVEISNYDPCAGPLPGSGGGTGMVFVADVGPDKLLVEPEASSPDGYTHIHIDVPDCAGDTSSNVHSVCNHPSTINTQNLTFKDNATGKPVTTTQLNCRGGACTIGIGLP